MRKPLLLAALAAGFTAAASLCPLASPPPAYAAVKRITQELSSRDSKVHFSLASSFIQFSGKFNSYSGTLELDNALTPSRLTVKLDASEVDLAPVEGLSSFNPEALFRTLPNPVVTFVSSAITPTGKNRYAVTGTVRRGQRSWPAKFEATLLKKTAQASEFYFTTTGPLLDLGSQLPLPAGTFDEASVECRLVFRTN